jgi:hypothetical protein
VIASCGRVSPFRRHRENALDYLEIIQSFGNQLNNRKLYFRRNATTIEKDIKHAGKCFSVAMVNKLGFIQG